MLLHRGLALIATAALPLSLLAVAGPTSGADPLTSSFNRVATYPVFQNVPAAVAPSAETVAEISAVTEDGRTVIYTDAPGKRIGFLDITDPANPVGQGTINLATAGHLDDQPTSVAVVGGHLLVVVDSTGGDFANPSGRLDVYRISDRTLVKEIDLGGQPDSIAISQDKAYAAIAMENQRDEEVNGGAIPQLPAGFLQVVSLTADPAGWSPAPLNFAGPVWDAAAPTLHEPTDPEPEYVSFNDAGKLAVTLQENNGVAIVDVPTMAIEAVWSAGTVTTSGIDTTKDGLFNPTGTITDVRREPDSIGWVDATHVATANEGDLAGGARGWTIFDSATGAVTWDAGNSFENLATRIGHHNNDRAAKKGAEPEGLSIATIGGKRRAFVGSERSNFVAVYDLTDPTKPVYEQALPATNGPEGLLPIPARNLFVVSSETDDASAGIRASVGVYAYSAVAPAYPTIASVDESNGFPIGWGALGALSAVPGNSGSVWAASDSAYKTGRIYKVDVTSSPALIERVIEVRDATGAKPAIDIEGLSARAGGGFWAAIEGATGATNKIARIAADGTIQSQFGLPSDVAAKVGKWGFEGVTSVGTGDAEQVYVVLQRPLFNDPATATGPEQVAGKDVTRIGRYDVKTGTWAWFGYQLETTTTPGDWMGVSEVTAVDANTLAVIERDKLNGPAANVKRVYTVTVPAAAGATLQVLPKKLAIDVLPALRAPKGWTQEKLEGLTIGADNNVYAVTDNDGLKDSTGETQFLKLGTRNEIFLGSGTAPTPVPSASPSARSSTAPTVTLPASAKATKTRLLVREHRGRKYTLIAKVSLTKATGRVVFTDKGKTLGKATVRRGVATLKVRLKHGKHKLRAKYAGNSAYLTSTSKVIGFRLR